MGQPSMARVMLPYGGRTQGSETSQYLKEEKSNEIPIVAASEMGLGQTRHLCLGLRTAICSLDDRRTVWKVGP
jgi:hypothetical protein